MCTVIVCALLLAALCPARSARTTWLVSLNVPRPAHSAIEPDKQRPLLLRGEPALQRGLAALAVPGQDIGHSDRQRRRGQAGRTGPGGAALLRRPVGPDQRETRRRLRWYRNDLDLSAGREGAGMDEPAEGDRVPRADRVKRAGPVV